MSSPRTTKLLLLLLALSTLACAIATQRAKSKHHSAQTAQEDLQQIRHDIAQLTISPANTTAPLSQTSDVDRLIRDAATRAGAADALAGVEPGRTNDAGETPVILGFTAVSLQQLATFVHTLGTSPTPVRTDAIELSAADSVDQYERWTATITISVRSSR